LPSNLANVIEDQFYQRWKMLTTGLHCAGFLFNPYLLGEACLHDDVDAKETLNIALQKKTCTLIAYALALKDFANFAESQGPFFNIPLVKDLDLFPHECWDLIGAARHTLTPITHHIWHKCVMHHRVSEIRVHIHLSTTKCKIG
jgi:hypothetical protein